jgi:glycosyltransferase involved in cell wall biosynthesis
LKISILTPSFNSGHYLEQAIRSVLAQNDPDFEHIVVDGGSKDETVSILRRYPHLRWVSEPDRGQCDGMNKAFARSSGEIIAYLNADDWFEPGTFAHVRQLLSGHSEAGMIVGNFYVRYADSGAIRLVVPTKTYRGVLLHFRKDFPLNPVSYFYRREVQESVGAFPLHLHYTMDYWFLVRAFLKYRVCCSDLVFGTFFITGANKTSCKAPGESAWEVATQHLREDNPHLLPWFYSHWLFHRWVREFPERAKTPFRYLAYKVLFSNTVNYDEYKALGFRRACRKRFRRHRMTA